MGFEPAIPAGWRPRNHALDRSTSGIGHLITCLALYRAWPVSAEIRSERVAKDFGLHSFVLVFVCVFIQSTVVETKGSVLYTVSRLLRV
jgi:hypothetical protein